MIENEPQKLPGHRPTAGLGDSIKSLTVNSFYLKNGTYPSSFKEKDTSYSYSEQANRCINPHPKARTA